MHQHRQVVFTRELDLPRETALLSIGLIVESDLSYGHHAVFGEKSRKQLQHVGRQSRVIGFFRVEAYRAEVAHAELRCAETLPIVLETGCWAGHSIYPNTKMDEHRMAALVKRYGTSRIIVNSAADWGISDPLKVPKTIQAMRQDGIPDDAIRTIVWDNPLAFFGQSGRFDLADVEQPAAIDRSQLFESNSVLRGERATAPTAR